MSNSSSNGSGFTLPSGEHLSEEQAERVLTGDPLTTGYKPRFTHALFWDGDGTRPPYQQILADVERMIGHPAVKNPYTYYKSGISRVKFTVRKASSPDVGDYAVTFYERVWERSLDQIQRAYDYGRGPSEVSYVVEDGILRYDYLDDFHPLECAALTRRKQYVGFRVSGDTGDKKLWGPDYVPGLPSKGFWFTHSRKYHRFYGLTQLYSAWRPFRRLASLDGAEEVVDGAAYRAVGGPKVFYPPNDVKRSTARSGSPDPESNREKAREMGELYKAGTSVGLPSVFDDKGNRLWDMELPNNVLDVSPLDAHCEKLERQISLGIGVPPELFEAAEVGSGWSGRQIPLIGFYVQQQRNAQWLAHELHWQILVPLLKWNFGDDAFVEIAVEVELSLPQTQQPGQVLPQPGQGQQQPGQGPRVEQPSYQMATAEDFDENKHPRADDGKFSAAGRHEVRKALKLVQPVAAEMATRDAVGHEHADDGRFTGPGKGGSGGNTSKAKPREQAADALRKGVAVAAKSATKAATASAKVVAASAAATKTAADRLGKAVWDKLPPEQQQRLTRIYARAKQVEHKLMAGFRKGRELAQEIARERGLPEEHVERVGRILGVADQVMAWTVNAPVVGALTGSVAAAKVSSFVPMASLAYIAGSTARNPFAALRAARKMLKAKPTPETAHMATDVDGDTSDQHELVEALFAGIAAHGDAYEAAIAVALDETRDLASAIAMADAAFEGHGDDKAKAKAVEMATEEDRSSSNTPDAAAPEADAILRLAGEAIRRFSEQARRELAAAFRSRGSPSEQMRLARQVLDRYQPKIAHLLTDARLAAALAGMRRVVTELPGALPPSAPGDALPVASPPEAATPDSAEATRLLAPLPETAKVEGEPPAIDWVAPMTPDGPKTEIEFPVIAEAVQDLRRRQMLTRPEFDALAAEARREAFTVAGVESEATLGKIREALTDAVFAGEDLKAFAKRMEDEGLGKSFLSDAHAENVFRTNVQASYAAGLDVVLSKPVVSELFPYVEYVAVHDDRARPEHKAMERHGIDGSAIYRRDDPVLKAFTPPWDYQCRCGLIPLSVERAAAKGVKEAETFLQTGQWPPQPAWVPWPPFQSSPGFRREGPGVEMATGLEPGDKWITIGGKDDSESGKKHVGGRRVLIDKDGNIKGGDVPKEWQGRHVKGAHKAEAKKESSGKSLDKGIQVDTLEKESGNESKSEGKKMKSPWEMTKEEYESEYHIDQTRDVSTSMFSKVGLGFRQGYNSVAQAVSATKSVGHDESDREQAIEKTLKELREKVAAMPKPAKISMRQYEATKEAFVAGAEKAAEHVRGHYAGEKKPANTFHYDETRTREAANEFDKKHPAEYQDHRHAVYAALESGKQVPENVLAQYPDLAAKAKGGA